MKTTSNKIHFASSLFFAFLFFCLNPVVKAQTLEFSRAIMLTASDNVPTGKVWKVISVGSNSAQNLSIPSSCATNYNSTQISVGGITTHVSARYGANGSGCYSSYSAGASISTTGDLTQLPFWIPEGTSLAPGAGAGFISVIEFTVN